MKRIVLVLPLMVLFLAGCSSSQDSGTASAFRSIPPREAARLIQTRRDILVVDVRTPGELKEGYIEGSVLVPAMDIIRGRRGLPKDRPLLIVCAVGGRSYAIGQLLARNGWPEVYNLSGGIAAWKRAGLPLRY